MKNRRKHWRSVVTVVGVALLLAAGLVGTKPHGVSAQSEDYSFAKIASLGDKAPKGGTFVNDFEPGGLNIHGDIAFGADVSTGGKGSSSGTTGKSRSWGAPTGPRRAAARSRSVSSDPSA